MDALGDGAGAGAGMRGSGGAGADGGHGWAAGGKSGSAGDQRAASVADESVVEGRDQGDGGPVCGSDVRGEESDCFGVEAEGGRATGSGQGAGGYATAVCVGAVCEYQRERGAGGEWRGARVFGAGAILRGASDDRGGEK